LGSVSSLVSEKKIFEISANQSILLALVIFAQQSGFICVDKKSKMASILAWDPSGKMTI
jgi:hypothetical protein